MRLFDNRQLHPEITNHVFVNSPTMMGLCFTMIGLIKIYSAIQRITTLTDDFLVGALAAFLFATMFSYLALRSAGGRRREILAKVADAFFLFGLTTTTVVAFFVAYSLAG